MGVLPGALVQLFPLNYDHINQSPLSMYLRESIITNKMNDVRGLPGIRYSACFSTRSILCCIIAGVFACSQSNGRRAVTALCGTSFGENADW